MPKLCIFVLCVLTCLGVVHTHIGSCGDWEGITLQTFRATQSAKCLQRTCCSIGANNSKNKCVTQRVCLNNKGNYCSPWTQDGSSRSDSSYQGKLIRKCCPECFWRNSCQKKSEKKCTFQIRNPHISPLDSASE
jgi:hypothetical protein